MNLYRDMAKKKKKKKAYSQNDEIGFIRIYR